MERDGRKTIKSWSRGRKSSTVNTALKQNKIIEEMSGVQAEKLFKPITSELKVLSTQPIEQKQPPKKQPTPDYGNPEEDLLPYEEELPTPKTSIKGLQPDSSSSTEEETFFGDLLQSLPSVYDEPEVPDYEILEEDKVNEVLDSYGLINYDNLTEKLQETTAQEKHDLLLKNIDVANKRRQQLPGYKTHITKQLKKGQISEAEAQYRRKTIDDMRHILNDYIPFDKNQFKFITGSGLKGRGGEYPLLFSDPTQLVRKLEVIVGSIAAGNNSKELRNTGVAILDMLLRNSIINKSHYNKIYKNFFLV